MASGRGDPIKRLALPITHHNSLSVGRARAVGGETPAQGPIPHALQRFRVLDVLDVQVVRRRIMFDLSPILHRDLSAYHRIVWYGVYY